MTPMQRFRREAIRKQRAIEKKKREKRNKLELLLQSRFNRIAAWVPVAIYQDVG